MTAKWKRIRPGLYHLTSDGEVLAIVERGAETGSWWYQTIYGDTGRRARLVLAKQDASESVKESLRWRPGR
jgi:hypothetical protein